MVRAGRGAIEISTVGSIGALVVLISLTLAWLTVLVKFFFGIFSGSLENLTSGTKPTTDRRRSGRWPAPT